MGLEKLLQLRLNCGCLLDYEGNTVNPCLRHSIVPRIENMTKKTTKKTVINNDKPTLVLVGESMVDPRDVAAIKKIRSRDDLYIVVLKSQPNMEFPMWANGEEIVTLLTYFNVVE